MFSRIISDPYSFFNLFPHKAEDDPFKDAEGGSGLVNTRIRDRESDYQKRRNDRVLREDGLSFKESMMEANLEKERDELIREVKKGLEEKGTKPKMLLVNCIKWFLMATA